MGVKAPDECWTMIRAYDRLKKISTDNGGGISNMDETLTQRMINAIRQNVAR